MHKINIQIASKPIIERLAAGTLDEDIFYPEDIKYFDGLSADRRKILIENIFTTWLLCFSVFRRRVQFVTPSSLIDLE